MTVLSTFAIWKPCSRTRRAASVSSSTESAPLKRSSVSGKWRADVAQAGGAQQRIGDRMQQHVGIGMPQQAALVRNIHAADQQRAARHQRVDVPAFADAEIRRSPQAALEHGLGQCEVIGVGHLEILRAAGHQQRPVAQRLDRRSPRRSRGCCTRSSACISRPMRNICGVCASHLSSRSSVCATRPPSSRLSVSGSLLGEQAAHFVRRAGVDQRIDQAPA